MGNLIAILYVCVYVGDIIPYRYVTNKVYDVQLDWSQDYHYWQLLIQLMV